MWIDRHVYEALVAKASGKDAANELASRYRSDLITANKEIRRLTNVIIHFKDKGKVIGPESTDGQWDRYTTVELEEEDAAREEAENLPNREAYGDTGFSTEEAAEAEAEFEVELNARLEAESGD